MAARPALEKSCAVLVRRGTRGPLQTAAADWQAPCAALLAAETDQAMRQALQQHFAAYQVISQQRGASGLFTGYYVPLLQASLTRGGPYQTPIHARPADLVEVNLGEFRENLRGQRLAGRVENGRLVPYADRAAIRAGALKNKGLELYWAKDPIAVFFMQIQGSGVVQLPDGSMQNVGYAAQNGHVYKAIGKTLIERGALTPEVTSLQTIRAWLQANPAEAEAVMASNPSYVFFQTMARGATGAAGVELTSGRALAVDDAFISYHVPLWLATSLPNGEPYQRLMVAQDTGGAILGVVRGDVFFGAGAEAEELAGTMKQAGEYYILLPKTVAINDAARAN